MNDPVLYILFEIEFLNGFNIIYFSFSIISSVNEFLSDT